jgi:hypothetical protein
VPRWLIPLTLALLFAAMAWATWNQWGDAQVDYGGEVYTAWRLSQGAVLYRDVAYFTGPLSPYLNALVLALGGGILGLQLFHLLLAACSAALIHALLRRIGGVWSAVCGTAAFLLLFCFARFEFLGNSNYIAPYSHETAHALPLCLGCLLLLERWRESPSAKTLVCAGLCLGAVLLTKLEHTLALGAAAVFFLAAARAGRAECLRFSAAALGVVGIAFGLLLTALPVREALRGVLGAWNYVFDASITDNPFYRGVMGTDYPRENLELLGIIAAAQIAALGLLTLLARHVRLPALLLFCLGASAYWLVPLQAPAWLQLARPWPLYTLLAAALLGWRAWREPKLTLHAAFALFALAMLAKMLLHTRLQMYGFALALPATLLVVCALCDWLARWRTSDAATVARVRAAGLGLFAAIGLGHLRVQAQYLSAPRVAVGEGRDRLQCDAMRGPVLESVRRELAGKLRPGERLAVLPEGVMLNYWLRAETPARYINYMPPELSMFGEERMVTELRAARPEAIVLLHKPTAEYGVPWFGKDYGRAFAAWIEAEYRPGTLHGEPPLKAGTRFGAGVLWRKDLVR